MATRAELKARHYTFVARAREDGWAIHFPDLPGAQTFVERMEDVGTAAKELFDDWVDMHFGDGTILPAPGAIDTSDPWDPAMVRDPDPDPDRLFTARELSEEFGINIPRVHAIAKARNLGTMRGNLRLFTESDREAMRTRNPGRPKGWSPNTHNQ